MENEEQQEGETAIGKRQVANMTKSPERMTNTATTNQLRTADRDRNERPATSDEIVAATGRYHLKAIELFGPERCMFESNFPVDKQSCSYHVLWNAFKKMTADFSDADKQWLFHDSAAKAYRL